MLASIGDALLSEKGGVSAPGGKTFLQDQYDNRWEILQQMPRLASEEIKSITEQTGMEAVDDNIHFADGKAWVNLKDANGTTIKHELSYEQLPTNTQEVGWQLVAGFPMGLEMAGVILLMAMFGAIVLARRQIELGEDERRQAAGLQPISEDEDTLTKGGGS